MTDNPEQDLALKKELEKIDWKKYLQYGNVRVRLWAGKMTLTTIERTYLD